MKERRKVDAAGVVAGGMRRMRDSRSSQDRIKFRNAAGRPTAPYRLVTTAIQGSGYRVELRDYCFKAPRDAIYAPIDHHLEFTVSPQPVRGGYPGIIDDLRPIGQVTLIPARHSFRAVNRSGVKRALVCDFADSIFADFGDLTWPAADLARCTDIRSLRLDALFSVLMEEVLAPGVGSEVLVEATIVSMMVELRRYFAGEPENSEGGRLAPWQIRLIRDQIDDGAGSAATIAQLAADCGLSSRQLARTFKATTGRRLGEYMKTARINQAKRLLGLQGLMIKEVAFECGFATAAAFAAAFRKATGSTPNEYRRRVRPGS